MKRDGSSKRSVLWLGSRIVLHIAFACLLAVWIADPYSPSRFYRHAFLGALTLAGVIALVGPIRRPAAALLGRVIRPIDLVTVNTVVFLVLAEASIRLLAIFSSMPVLVPEDARTAKRLQHWRYAPRAVANGFAVNSLGFFDDEFEVERRPGVRRLVVLADSFGVGAVPFEENFLTLLDDLLDEHQPTEVLNFAVPAVGPREYLHLYRSEARHYEPDRVLVCFFVGNDFERRRSPSFLHRERWMVFNVFRRIGSAMGEAPGPELSTGPTFSKEAFLEVERARLNICRREPTSTTRQQYEDTFPVLEELHVELGERLKLVMIPDEFEVNDDLYRTLVGDDGAAFDRELPDRRLAEFLASRDIDFLDLLGPLREAQKTGPTYKLRDTHWNRLGNAVAAAEIARWLLADPAPGLHGAPR